MDHQKGRKFDSLVQKGSKGDLLAQKVHKIKRKLVERQIHNVLALTISCLTVNEMREEEIINLLAPPPPPPPPPPATAVYGYPYGYPVYPYGYPPLNMARAPSAAPVAAPPAAPVAAPQAAPPTRENATMV